MDIVEQYKPIALSNFKFKIISKVLTERLANISPNIIYVVTGLDLGVCKELNGIGPPQSMCFVVINAVESNVL